MKATVNVHTQGEKLDASAVSPGRAGTTACPRAEYFLTHSCKQMKVMLPRISAQASCQNVFKDEGDMRALLMANPFSLYYPKALCYASS